MSQAKEPARIDSLDQFRGYTVLGMFFVNFIGGFAAIHAIFKHHNTYCSYADTIMPQFLFAVGFSYRLTFLRRMDAHGVAQAAGHAISRNLGLILLGLVVYHLDGRVSQWKEVESWWASFQSLSWWGKLESLFTPFQRNPFQTLVHIGVTSLWVLPVIGARPLIQIAFLLFSAALHLALAWGVLGGWSSYEWVMRRPGIDGGPLGFLTWTIPILVGSLAYDAYRAKGPSSSVGSFFLSGSLVMLIGYGLSCLNTCTSPNAIPAGASWTAYLADPPFVKPPTQEDGKTLLRLPNMWNMSQRAGNIPYLLFGAGFSLAVYGLFVWLCDLRGWRLVVFRTLGTNALAGYIIHDMVSDLVKPYVPRDAPLWYALAATGLYLSICYLFLRYMEKHKLYLRL